MSKDFMPEVDLKLRLQALVDTCHSSEETTYYRDLSPEELDIKRETLTENLIKVSEADEVLDGAKAVHKAATKPLKEENKILVNEVKMRKSAVKGKIFHLTNFEDSTMETYDEQGLFISSRRLRPDEKQARLFVAGEKKNGTEHN